MDDMVKTQFTCSVKKMPGTERTFRFIGSTGSADRVGDVIEVEGWDLKNWKKNKAVPKDTMNEILNVILMRCNVEALILSRDVNLPPPIPLPKIQR